MSFSMPISVWSGISNPLLKPKATPINGGELTLSSEEAKKWRGKRDKYTERERQRDRKKQRDIESERDLERPREKKK